MKLKKKSDLEFIMRKLFGHILLIPFALKVDQFLQNNRLSDDYHLQQRNRMN